MQFNIYIKPSTTDIITQNDSFQPPEHKLAAFTYLTVYRDTPWIILRKERKMVHKNHIIRNNNYDTAILNKVSRTKNEQE